MSASVTKKEELALDKTWTMLKLVAKNILEEAKKMFDIPL